MTTEARVREYLAEKAETLDVSGAPLPAASPPHRWGRGPILVVAAVVALIAIGLPLFILLSRSPEPVVEPLEEEPPPAKEAAQLSWTTGTIPNGQFGTVVEVPDGWLFVPQIPGEPAWLSADGEHWDPVGALFPPDASVFGVVRDAHGYLAYDGFPGEFGPSGSGRAWHSADGRTWAEVQPEPLEDPLPDGLLDIVRYQRAGTFAASRDRIVFAGFFTADLDLDALARSLGLESQDGDVWGQVIGSGPGGELTGELSLQRDGQVVWKTTFDELGLPRELVAALNRETPTDFSTWASDDGGFTWVRGETVPGEGPYSALAATEDGFLLVTGAPPGPGFDAHSTKWLSSDGLHWRAVDADPELFTVEASADRFLGSALATPDELWVSTTGASWELAGEDMDGFPQHEAASFFGGDAGFVLIRETNEADGTYTWTALTSVDGYTWTETGFAGSLSPPDYSGVEFAAVFVGERSFVVVEREHDVDLIVHVGVASG